MNPAFNHLEHIARQPVAEARLQQLIASDNARRAREQRMTPAESIELGLTSFDAGRFSPEEAICYVHVMLAHEVNERTQAAYRRDFSDRFDAIRVKHRLGPDEDWPAGKGPEEYEALSRQVVVDDVAALLEVNALGQHIRRQQYVVPVLIPVWRCLARFRHEAEDRIFPRNAAASLLAGH